MYGNWGEGVNNIVLLKPLRSEGKYRFIFTEDGAYIYHIASGEIKVANKTGAFILREFDGTKSIADIINRLKTLFPKIDGNKIASDVISFIKECLKEGFISLQE